MVVEKNQSFGELLRDIRDQYGLSMRVVAGAADMDPAYLSRIENGKTGAPKQETVEKLASALCTEQKLESSECDRIKRRLLVAAGHLQDKEELIDDLAERFAAKLRAGGFPKDKIEEALARVSLPTMRAVLVGEEKLEIGYVGDFSMSELQARKDAGEQVLSFNLETLLMQESAKAADSAASYLDRHAEDFASHRRKQRTKVRRDPRRKIRAGQDVEIRINRSINKEQEHQLRLIAKLITTILEEK